MSLQVGARERVWRAGPVLRAVIYIEVVVFVALALLIAFGSGLSLGPRVLAPLAIVALAGIQWWFYVRPRLVADETGLVVVRGRHPVRIAWAEVADVNPDSGGLTITLTDGRRVRSRYPQESTLARATRDATVAREAATFVLERAEAARRADGETVAPLGKPAVGKGETRRQTRWELILLVSVFATIVAAVISAITLSGAYRTRTNEVRVHGVPAVATVEGIYVSTMQVRYDAAGASRSVRISCFDRAHCNDYEVGNRVEVRVDPANPDRAVLAATPYTARDETIAWIVLALCVAALPVLVPLLVIRLRHGRRRPRQ